MSNSSRKYTAQEVAVLVQQARKNLLDSITYELFTPLTTIRSLAEVLQDGLVKSEPDQHLYHAKIISETQNMEQLVADLIELSKLQNGCLSFDKKAVRMADIFGPVFERFLMRYADIEIALDLDQFNLQSIPFLHTEADRLVRLLNILLDNSVRLAGQNETVRVTHEISPARVTFCIQTSAVISEINMDRLFSSLYDSDAGCIMPINRIEFAIAGQIACGLNEKLWAESSEDKGTAFYITVTFDADQ